VQFYHPHDAGDARHRGRVKLLVAALGAEELLGHGSLSFAVLHIAVPEV
jgi:hypothetical protein